MSESPATLANVTTSGSGESWLSLHCFHVAFGLRGTPCWGPVAQGLTEPLVVVERCRTGMGRPVPSWLHPRWGKLSRTALRTSQCAIAGPRRCCRRPAIPVHSGLNHMLLQDSGELPTGELTILAGVERLRLAQRRRLGERLGAKASLRHV